MRKPIISGATFLSLLILGLTAFSNPAKSAAKACTSTCTQCNNGNTVGYFRELAPFLNDDQPADYICNDFPPCGGLNCYDAAEGIAADLETAARQLNWEEVDALASEHESVLIPDVARGVADIMNCDGTAVLITLPLSSSVIARMNAVQAATAEVKVGS